MLGSISHYNSGLKKHHHDDQRPKKRKFRPKIFGRNPKNFGFGFRINVKNPKKSRKPKITFHNIFKKINVKNEKN